MAGGRGKEPGHAACGYLRRCARAGDLHCRVVPHLAAVVALPESDGFRQEINFDPLVRSGYIWVDMMILISGFCLYLPWARLGEGEKGQSPAAFYEKAAGARASVLSADDCRDAWRGAGDAGLRRQSLVYAARRQAT